VTETGEYHSQASLEDLFFFFYIKWLEEQLLLKIISRSKS